MLREGAQCGEGECCEDCKVVKQHEFMLCSFIYVLFEWFGLILPSSVYLRSYKYLCTSCYSAVPIHSQGLLSVARAQFDT